MPKYIKIPLKILSIILTVMVVQWISSGNFYGKASSLPSSDANNMIISNVKTNLKPQVLGESTSSDPNGAVLTSEDYKIKQVTMGGSMEASVSDKGDDLPFKISDVTNQLITTKDKNATQMILSWKTNRSAISEVDYAKNGNDSFQSVKEDEYTYSHTVVIPSLDPATVYAYTIKSRDSLGNQDTSDKFILYTGAPNVSFLDVLQNATQKAFGWAIKK